MEVDLTERNERRLAWHQEQAAHAARVDAVAVVLERIGARQLAQQLTDGRARDTLLAPGHLVSLAALEELVSLI